MLFKARLIVLLVISVILLPACEKRPDNEVGKTSFSFTLPNEDCKPEDTSQKTCVFGDEIARVKIKYAGVVRASNFRLKVNGVPLTANLPVDSKVKFVANNNIVAELPDIKNALKQGENTLEAQKLYVDASGYLTDEEGELLLDLTGNSLPIDQSEKIKPEDKGKEIEHSKSYTFFFDNLAPRIIVNEIKALDANGNVKSIPKLDSNGDPILDNDGNAIVQPAPPAFLDKITVKGVIEDVSDVEKLVFTYPGGSVSLKKVENVAQLEANQYKSTNGIESGEFFVELPNYPDTRQSSNSPHFSYTAVDDVGHSRTESFLAPGGVVSDSFALQLNDSLPVQLNQLSEAAFQNILNLIYTSNMFGIAEPLLNDGSGKHAQTDEIMLNPEKSDKPCKKIQIVNNIFAKQCYPGKENNGKYPKGTSVYIYPITPPPGKSSVCSELVFDKRYGVTHCIVFVTNVVIDSPRLDISFKDTKTTNLQMKTGVWLNQAKVNIEVAGASQVPDDGRPNSGEYVFRGSLTGMMKIPRFRVGTGGYDLFPAANKLIAIDRVPPLFIEQTDLIQVPEINANCNICSPLMNPFLIAYFILGSDIDKNDIKDNEQLVTFIGEKLEEKLGPILDDFLIKYANDLNPVVHSAKSTSDIYNFSSNTAAYDVYNDNGHLRFNSGYTAGGYNYGVPGSLPDALIDMPNIGSMYATQGSYVHPPLKKNPPRWNPDERADFSFALSANSINEWLLAKHQTDNIYEFDILGADLGNLDLDQLGIVSGDELHVVLTTGEAPYVVLSSDEKCNFGICWSELYAPGRVKLVLNHLGISVVKGTEELVNANINLELEFNVNAYNGLPKINIISNSVHADVNDVFFGKDNSGNLIPGSKFLFGYQFAKALEFFVSTDNQRFKNNIVGLGIAKNLQKIDITKLPGLGGSGANCAAPSKDGNVCIKGNPTSTEVAYKALFKGLLPRDYAMYLKWLTVEKNSSYLSVGMAVRNTSACRWSASEDAEHFLIFRLWDGVTECHP